MLVCRTGRGFPSVAWDRAILGREHSIAGTHEPDKIVHSKPHGRPPAMRVGLYPLQIMESKVRISGGNGAGSIAEEDGHDDKETKDA